MFNSLYGIITDLGTNTIYLRTGDIEWEIHASSNTVTQYLREKEQIRVYTFLYHREDQLVLYGFYSKEERSVFLDLLSVNGIGPKQAVRVLSGIGIEEFIAYLREGNVNALSQIPGLGKKTAQKIILSLQGKLHLEEEDDTSQDEDIVNALVDMGFEKRSVKKAVDEIRREIGPRSTLGDEQEKELFKEALLRLSR